MWNGNRYCHISIIYLYTLLLLHTYAFTYNFASNLLFVGSDVCVTNWCINIVLQHLSDSNLLSQLDQTACVVLCAGG